MMNFATPIGHSEGQSTTRPPLFYGTHFSWWKARIEIFIQGKAYELWDRVTDGPTISMNLVDGEQVKKVRSKFTADDLTALRKNTRAKNILVFGLVPAEYNRVSTCTTAKKIFNSSENAHEGTIQVKKIKIALLFTEYEAFRMRENESLHQMMSRLTALTNELTSLGKTITTKE